jgi:choice-of-anchor B domain-containing protein
MVLKQMKNFLVTCLACILLCGGFDILAAGEDTTPEHDETEPYDPVPTGSTAANCQDGVSSGYACKNIEMLSRLSLAEIGGGSGADSWGWKDEENDRYYALIARSTGVSFVDVTDPEVPIYLGNLPTESGNEPWRDVKTYSNHAFVVADNIAGHGLQVFDLTRLRGVVTPQEFSTDATYKHFGPAHNIAINEQTGFAYVTGSDTCQGGLHIIDIRSPKAPVNAGCFSADGYTHDVHCTNYDGPDSDHAGIEVCLASNEDSITIVDVSDKQNPEMISRLEYPQARYAHQGWLTDDHRYFILGDELDERGNGSNVRTRVFNVEDLDSPQYTGAHIGSNPTIDHNLYARGPFLFQANYQAGLRILLMEDLEQAKMREIAFFDTYSTRDSREFSGAWNVYPFFDNGTILVSDMQGGLFVLRAALPGAEVVSSPINGQLSGAWIADGLNDQGLILFVGESSFGPFMYFAWFIFLDGKPFWITGDSPFEYGDSTVVIPTQRLEGLEFLTRSDAQATRFDIGTTTIHKHDCRAIHVNYDWGVLGSDEIEMTRIAGVEGRQCADDGTRD